jgi:hypothetical protein
LDRLLAGGQFFKYRNAEDTVWAFSKAQWNGARWDSLGARIPGGDEYAAEVYWFLRYQGRLYTCGDFVFSTLEGYNRAFARLNEQTLQWEPLECINTGPSGLRTLVPKEPQGTLYATGFGGVLCDQFPPTCVYSYDGSSFHRWAPFDLLPEVPLAHVSYIFDFRGKTYMIGAFPGPGGQGVASFIRYNGSDWELVPGWNNLMASIWDYTIRNDTLYIGGDFREADGGPGNLVASFDGEQWNDMGGGFACNNCWSANTVNALQWFHGELWACGMFDQVVDVPAHGIAKWDGHRWCVPPGNFLQVLGEMSPLYDMAVWRDSLYVCGLFETVDGEPAHQVVRWDGGSNMENCSSPMGVVEQAARDDANQLRVEPLPGNGEWIVRFPHADQWKLDVYDAEGRHVRSQVGNGANMELDIGAEAPGMYLLRASTPKGMVRSAKIVRP